MQGQLPQRRVGTKVVAIVGARRCTSHGENIAYRLAFELAQYGVIVVSGLAYGIDSCAHRGCLDAGGITVAVLGTAIDNIYPKAHYRLAERILERGAILSEWPPSVETYNWCFAQRNRIISGLADVLVVVEAAARSGTQSTAAAALDQGKDVYAIPGDITRPLSEGCNRLILDGAQPLISIDNFVQDLTGGTDGRQDSRTKKLAGMARSAQDIIAAMTAGLQSSDEILGYCAGLSVAEFNQQMTLLELRGLVRPCGATRWVLL
ncbi:DNA-processing protein DprA [Candidatus Saccharibacteria bacterium]|nr:DNA-processing protein DprA [Candidatus Saccharibacteria bacterium]